LKKIFNPFTYIRKIRQLIEKLVKSVRKSIRIQLITTFAACALLGVLSAKAAAPFFENANRQATIDYRAGMEQINHQAQGAANSSVHENKLEAISNMIEMENQNLEQGSRALKILVTDESGKVLYKTKQAQEEQIDCIIRFVMQHHSRLIIQMVEMYLKVQEKSLYLFHLLLLKERICTCLLVEFQRER